MNNGIEVKAQSANFANRIDVAIFERRLDGSIYIAKEIPMVWVKVDENFSAEPTMRLHREVAQKFCKALTEALTDAGIPPESESHLKGRIEATERHLADLRQMLKLK